jgi:hypothetical protein
MHKVYALYHSNTRTGLRVEYTITSIQTKSLIEYHEDFVHAMTNPLFTIKLQRTETCNLSSVS